jgi:hypothetical protein
MKGQFRIVYQHFYGQTTGSVDWRAIGRLAEALEYIVRNYGIVQSLENAKQLADMDNVHGDGMAIDS